MSVKNRLVVFTGSSRAIEHVVADQIDRAQGFAEAIQGREDFLRIVLLVELNDYDTEPGQETPFMMALSR